MKILLLSVFLITACGPGQNVFESINYGLKNIIEGRKNQPQTLSNPKLAHVKRLVELTDELIKIKDNTEITVKRIIDSHEGIDNKVIDIVLSFSKENQACLKEHALDDEFFNNKQQRGGYLGWTLPSSCQENKETYKEFSKQDRRVLQRNIDIKSTDCTRRFPQSHEDIKSDRHFINQLSGMYAEQIKCYERFYDQIKEYDQNPPRPSYIKNPY